MNKKVLTTAIAAVQNSSEQNKLKIKTLIANLGAATQLTLGGGGNQNEQPRQVFSVYF